MKIAFIGAGHWHLGLFWPAALKLSDVEIVGLADPELDLIATPAKEAGCPTWQDYRALCADAKPDFVFAFGKHSDMAAEANFLIDEGIPFSMEKPCGMNADEVTAIAERAEQKGVFAEVPFVFRESEFVKRIKQHADSGGVEYLSFRFIGGPPSRYLESGCHWMLDPHTSGGGPTRNIGIHFFDLFRYLSDGDEGVVVSSTMENRSWGLPIEDYAAIVLRNRDTTCLIETGYGYPAPHGLQDMRFSARTKSAYLTALDRDTFEVIPREGGERELVANVPLTNYYGSALCERYMGSVVDRVRAGEPPQGTLRDMAAISKLVDAAYRQAGQEVWPAITP